MTGPLAQFQAKVADRHGVIDVLRSLGAVAGIQENVVDARFDRYWEDLEESIAAANLVCGMRRLPTAGTGHNQDAQATGRQ